MFGIGSGEMLVFAVVVLIALGPKRLPEFMKVVGKGLREIRRATTDLRKHSGIDELMRDDPAGLRALSQDISRAPAPRREHKLTAEDRAKESPPEGVDLAHAGNLSDKKLEQLAVAAAPVPEAAAAPASAAAKSPVLVSPTVPVVGSGSAPAKPVAAFDGDTVPDTVKVVPAPATSEPTMMGVPVVDPYADAKVALSFRSDAAPKPQKSVPPPPPSEALSKRPSGIPRIPAPPRVPAVRSAPPPPPPRRVAPSGPPEPGSKRASLPASIPPPAPSEPPTGARVTSEAPNAREATMALETEDLNPVDES